MVAAMPPEQEEDPLLKAPQLLPPRSPGHSGMPRVCDIMAGEEWVLPVCWGAERVVLGVCSWQGGGRRAGVSTQDFVLFWLLLQSCRPAGCFPSSPGSCWKCRAREQLRSAESEPAFSQMPGRHVCAVNSDYRARFSVVAQWEIICRPVEETQETRVRSLVGKVPWSKKWQPSPVFWPGAAHGQRSLVGYSPRRRKELDTPGRLSTHWLS